MNNPFGDFMGKSTEITDLVMNQQHENEFVNLTDRLTSNLNSINNNLMNNGSHDADENIIAIDNSQNYQPQQDILILNDDNNNSNNNFNSSDFGPETDVDAMDEPSQATGEEASGGEKEKSQKEFKETDDVVDRVEVATFNLLGEVSEFDQVSKVANQEFNPQSLPAFDNQMVDQFQLGFTQESSNFGNDFACGEKLMENQETINFDFSQNSMQNPFVNPQEYVPSQSDFMRHDESMQLLEEEELISANDVNEEVAIQKSEEPKMTGEFLLISVSK